MTLDGLLADHGMLIALVLGLLALGLLALVLWLLARGGRSGAKAGPGAAAARGAARADAAVAGGGAGDAPIGGTVPTFIAFRQTLWRLAERSGMRSPYALPWYLLMGEAGSGKTAFIRSARIPRLLPEEDTPVGADATLHCFEGGVVIDAAGDLVLRADGGSGDQDRWRGLMRRFQVHRPQRGLDGVIVTLACADFIGPGALPGESLAVKGDLLQERLADLMRCTGLRLPVYVVVTGCDRLRGFADFWQYTAEGGPGTMLGWSRPQVGDQPFDPAEIDGAMAEIGASLQRHYIDAAAGLDKPNDPDGMFRFPGEFAGLATPLKTILGRLLRVPPYQDGHVFRGVWFTGAEETVQPASVIAGPAAAVDPPGPALPSLVPLAAAPAGGPRPGPTLGSVSGLGPASGPGSGLGTGPGALPGRRRDPRILFVTDLLAEKVFRETRLTRAARSGIVARTRSERLAQVGLFALILMLTVGLFFTDRSLTRLAGHIEHALDLIRVEISGAGTRPAGTFNSRVAGELLVRFEKIDRNSMAYPLLPSSWAGGTEEAVSRAFGIGLKALVLSDLHHALETRYVELGRGGAAVQVPRERSHLLPGAPDIESIIAYLGRVRDLDRMATEYARINNGSAMGLADLANALFGARLGGDFSQHANLYEQGLRLIDAPHVGHETHENAINPALQRMSGQLILRIGPDGPIAARAARLRDAVDAVNAAPPQANMSALMQEMASALIDVRQMLDDPGFFWLAAPDITGVPVVAELLKAADTRSIRTTQRERFAEFLRMQHTSLRKTLDGMKIARGGESLFEKSDSGAGLRLNPRLHALSEHFRPTLERPFMQVQATTGRLRPAPAAGSGLEMRWDPARLAAIIAHQRSFEDLKAVDLQRIPGDFQGAVQRMALQRLEGAIRTELVAAQQIGRSPDGLTTFGEAALTAEVRDLRLVSEQLVAVMTILRQNGMDALNAEFRTAVRDHGYGLLEQLTSLLEFQSFYEPVDGFAGWDGTGTPLGAGFYAADRVAMAQYLDNMRGRIEHLWDNGGAPLVMLLLDRELGTGVQDPTVLTEWQRIGQEIQRYQARAPGSTLAALEQFLRFDLEAVRLETCEATLGAEEGALSSDFFLSRRDRARDQLLDRCRSLTGIAIAADYVRLTERFNRDLAGRYPFVAGAATIDAPEADPEDVAVFLRDFAAMGERLGRAVAGRAKVDPTAAAAARFLERMTAVHAFLAPFAAPGGAQVPPPAVFEVTADFRVNRAREREANQIIDWQLQLGAGDLRNGGAPSAVWRPGDPVALRLRWAKDGSMVPRARGLDMGVEDRTAVFDYRGRWALIRLLQAHRGDVEDFGTGGDPQPHTLRIIVPVGPAADPGSGADLVSDATAEARVYLRLSLTSTGPATETQDAPRRRHVLPVFPASAPPLSVGPEGDS